MSTSTQAVNLRASVRKLLQLTALGALLAQPFACSDDTSSADVPRVDAGAGGGGASAGGMPGMGGSVTVGTGGTVLASGGMPPGMGGATAGGAASGGASGS